MADSLTFRVESPSSQVTVYVRRVESWQDVLRELAYFPRNWIFRGQRDASWRMRVPEILTLTFPEILAP